MSHKNNAVIFIPNKGRVQITINVVTGCPKTLSVEVSMNRPVVLFGGIFIVPEAHGNFMCDLLLRPQKLQKFVFG